MLDIKQRKMDSFKTLDHPELPEVVGGRWYGWCFCGWIYYWIRAHKEKVR